MRRILYKHPDSKFIAWPADFVPMYNASHEPCDMLVGFCSCGASHSEHEQRIRDILDHHNAEVQDYPENPTRDTMLEVLGAKAIQAIDEAYAFGSLTLTLSNF